jgi:hypothetical protein
LVRQEQSRPGNTILARNHRPDKSRRQGSKLFDGSI